MDYLDELTGKKINQTKATNRLRLKSYIENNIKSIIGVVAAVFILGVCIAYLYDNRYERFKEKRTFWRYDKWRDVYEKYDIPSKKWKDASYPKHQ